MLEVLLSWLAVDGYWLEWGEWSECSSTCDTGIQMRLRECVAPVGDGQPCMGDGEESQQCWQQACASE